MSMLVVIVGGNLQGVEAVYLAKKAVWDVLVIDKDPAAGASLICDRFLPLTINSETDPHDILTDVDLIIPALENEGVLTVLEKWSRETSIPLTFDMAAYAISSSKKKSDEIFKEIGINAPESWPQCGFPIVVKPDSASGSAGVKIIHNENELTANFPTKQALDQMVAQEYLQGPSYSIEIIGSPGNYIPLQVTELQMDSDHDCKQVLAPVKLDAELVNEFEEMAIKIAEGVQLKGIMDVEVILHDGRLKILEIDARLPSQTPTAVFQSTGINMLQLLADLFLKGKVNPPKCHQRLAVIYEHIKVSSGNIEQLGEHIVSGAGPLRLVNGLFGADEVITNYRYGMSEWVATLILKNKSDRELLDKKRHVYDNIRDLVAHDG